MYRDSIEYRDTFSRYVSWHEISGIAQHYPEDNFWNSPLYMYRLPNFCVFYGNDIHRIFISLGDKQFVDNKLFVISL